ncbi:MAG: tRNA (adenosine(37)-N6)-dimethylallyltransferase MiaA [Clostridia bacterium]
MKKLVIICGATASGKSSFAIELAQLLDTSIISCDSMQIYKDMNIGTAKTNSCQMQGIKHYMLNVVEPTKEYSVSQYVSDCQPIVDTISDSGAIPIVVGGTGLYIDGLIYPMSFFGEKNEEVRNRLMKECDSFGAQYMHDKLKKIDSAEAEKIHCNNTKRVIRALEIFETSGKLKNDFQDKKKGLLYDIFMIFLNPPREVLYQNINNRVEKMFDDGLITEVEQLLKNGVTWEMQSMQAIGYKELKNYFEKTMTLAETIDLVKVNTRHYAKRQICWFKRYNFAHSVDPTSELECQAIKKMLLEWVRELDKNC